MAQGIAQPFLGKNLSITITPQDVAANGALTDNAIGAFSLGARLDSAMMDEDQSLAFENITPGDVPGANAVPYEIDGTWSLMEIATALPQVDTSHKGFGYGSVLRKSAKVSFYMKIVAIIYDNTPVAVETMTLFCVMTQPRSIAYAKNKTVDKVTLKLVQIYDPATGLQKANPAYT